jgi:hypothetical protein
MGWRLQASELIRQPLALSSMNDPFDERIFGLRNSLSRKCKAECKTSAVHERQLKIEKYVGIDSPSCHFRL